MGIDIGDLRKLSFDLGNAGLKATDLASKAVRKTALDIEADAKTLAPVDTGNLKGSIGTDILGPLAAEVGPTASYGHFVESGTSRMAAQPYMGPAFDRRSPGLVAAMEQIADQVL
jgi:HK97 gp10 family phage protein